MDINEKRNDTSDEISRLERADTIVKMKEEENDGTSYAVNEPILPSKLHQVLITNDKTALFEMVEDNCLKN